MRSGGRRRSANAVRGRGASCDQQRNDRRRGLEEAGCVLRQSVREKYDLRRRDRKHAGPVLVVRVVVIAEFHRMVAGMDLRDQQAERKREAHAVPGPVRVSSASVTSHGGTVLHLSSPLSISLPAADERSAPRPSPAPVTEERFDGEARLRATWPVGPTDSRRRSSRARPGVVPVRADRLRRERPSSDARAGVRRASAPGPALRAASGPIHWPREEDPP